MGFSRYAINAEAADTGVKVDLGNGESVTVARSGNKNFNKELRKVAKKYGNAFQSLGDEKIDQVVTEVYCRTVLLGWDGFEVPYSPAEAYKVMIDPANAPFRKLVEDIASNEETFRTQLVEEVVGE